MNKQIYLFIFNILFCSIILAEKIDIGCPDPANNFNVNGPRRTGQTEVDFTLTFFGQSNFSLWSPITLKYSMNVKGNPNVTPNLQVVTPILLTKTNDGNWVVVCNYSETTHYGWELINNPQSTLTIPSSRVKECHPSSDWVITCTLP